MDELFEAYLAVYEAFNEKGEFRRDEEDAPSRVTLSPEELAKRRALTASQTPEEKEAAAARRRELAAKILNQQNEETEFEKRRDKNFVPISPEKEARMSKRQEDLTKATINSAIEAKNLQNKKFKRFRPGLQRRIEAAKQKARNSGEKALTIGDARINANVGRLAKDMYDNQYFEPLHRMMRGTPSNAIRRFTREELEYILDVLVYEGYADNYDGARFIMESMSDEWLEEILGE